MVFQMHWQHGRRGTFCAVFGFLGLLTSTISVAAAELSHREDLSVEDRARVVSVTAAPSDFEKPEPFEAMSGGAATSRATPNRDAFSQSSANLDFEDELTFKLGNGLFRKLWVSSPSSTQASDGLGPLFNARSCQRCHLKDGRGHPPASLSDSAVSMLMRLSVPPRTAEEKAAFARGIIHRVPEPTYGGQLQDHAVQGIPSEGRIQVDYEDHTVTLARGEQVSLRKPTYRIVDLGYGPLDPEVMISPRIAPQMIGLGLLDAVHPGDIIALADPNDSDGDGVSGRISRVYDSISGTMTIGRFGWKANTPSVQVQSAEAFNGDIGISSPLVKSAAGDCTPAQEACLALPDGVQARLGDSEAPDPVLDLVVFYSANLAVPARRDVSDPTVLRGKALFHAAGCAACHTPKFVTRRDAEREHHRFQLIWPYTDMLLHDMGEGLSDNRPLSNAGPREWRTPPLWGIGLTKLVNGHTNFLHDGRARNLLEAIIWHGGEAAAAKDALVDMPPEDRNALIRFLESL